MSMIPRHDNSADEHSRSGYVTLISVLIVGAVGLAITLSMMVLGVGSSRTSFAVEQSGQARGLADGCAEMALQRIVEDGSFTGSDQLTFGSGTCEFSITGQVGEQRRIAAVGRVGTIVRKVVVDVSAIAPAVIIASWQEVAD